MTSRKSKQSSLNLLRKLWLQSQTKYVAYTQAVSAAGLASLDYVNNVISDQHFKDLLNTMTVDKKVYIGLAVIALVTWLAHGRQNA